MNKTGSKQTDRQEYLNWHGYIATENELPFIREVQNIAAKPGYLTRSFRIIGPVGSGKTTLSQAVARELANSDLHHDIIRLSCSDLFQQYFQFLIELNSHSFEPSDFFFWLWSHIRNDAVLIIEDLYYLLGKTESIDFFFQYIAERDAAKLITFITADSLLLFPETSKYHFFTMSLADPDIQKRKVIISLMSERVGAHVTQVDISRIAHSGTSIPKVEGILKGMRIIQQIETDAFLSSRIKADY